MARFTRERAGEVLRLVGFVAALGLGAAALLAAGSWLQAYAARPGPLDAEAAQALARRLGAVHADVQSHWVRAFRANGRIYAPPELVFYTRATPTPCAGAEIVAGPFYCPADGRVALDLDFFGALVAPLGPDSGNRATALIVAHVAAAHVQRELHLLADAGRAGASGADPSAVALASALQADCLAGLWAGAAAPRIGDVPAEDYRRAIEGARDAGLGRALPTSTLALGRPAAREAAFRRGLEAGALAGCLNRPGG